MLQSAAYALPYDEIYILLFGHRVYYSDVRMYSNVNSFPPPHLLGVLESKLRLYRGKSVLGFVHSYKLMIFLVLCIIQMTCVQVILAIYVGHYHRHHVSKV